MNTTNKTALADVDLRIREAMEIASIRRPTFVRIAEIPWRGGVVLAVPDVPSGECDPVRVMLANDDRVDVAD